MKEKRLNRREHYSFGTKFDSSSRLTFLFEAEEWSDNTRRGFFLCECGNIKEASIGNVKYGQVLSCGCLQKERQNEAHTTHGMSNHDLYPVYTNMIGRCYSKNFPNYKDYGGRGIIVCERWKDRANGFSCFASDMGERPEGYTLERVDVNGNYCPENCIWDNWTNQVYNQRVRKNNKSGYPGVRYIDNRNVWQADIRKNKKYYYIGKYKSFEEAVKARQEKELELYGKLSHPEFNIED